MVYLPYVAGTLNNQANLIGDDTQRHAEAEALYAEALLNYRQLAKNSPRVYLPYVAVTLNNQANLLQADTLRRQEAEALYDEALLNYRQLAKSNPHIYLPELANTLGAFGMAYLNWELPDKARPLLKESTEKFSPFAKQLPTIFGDKQASTLILAVQADPENIKFICTAMTEAAGVAQTDELKKFAITKISNDCKEAGKQTANLKHPAPNQTPQLFRPSRLNSTSNK